MKIALMQPYLFPYIGYFQLIHAVDQFVIHDDVQYINGGWINRNRILVSGQWHYITLPVKKDAHYLDINKRYFTEHFEKNKQRILRQIEGGYRKAPYYENILKLVEQVFTHSEKNVSAFLMHQLSQICAYIGIKNKFPISSKLKKNNTLKGQDRVIEITRMLEADHYVNLIGGRSLYTREAFAKRSIKLSFLKTKIGEYPQFTSPYVLSSSIIDVLMFNNKEKLNKILNEYELIE